MSRSDVVIRVEGLGKKYALHHETSERYTALRDVVARQARATGRLLNPFTLAGQLRKAQREAAPPSEEEFWALKDVSFEIRRGERVGIIGRNGAGKSTLLKILSRITEPTTGRVEIRGRVASLLEVGTGFHPELTGRENIYLNGAILGMTRREIRSKFDQIVDFAEVEKFLDTPVKRYSSGMYVRLAFAVAAHLEPEILVVDEVLAVGDQAFQDKCIGKMGSIKNEGRTLLFVSHNMGAIRKTCERALLLKESKLYLSGQADSLINEYIGFNKEYKHPAKKIISMGDIEDGDRRLYPLSIEVVSSTQKCSNSIYLGDSFKLLVALEGFAEDASICFIFRNASGERLASVNSYEQHCRIIKVNKGCYVICKVERMMLAPGTYSLDLWIGGKTIESHAKCFSYIQKCIYITVLEKDIFKTGKIPKNTDGCVVIPASWELTD